MSRFRLQSSVLFCVGLLALGPWTDQAEARCRLLRRCRATCCDSQVCQTPTPAPAPTTTHVCPLYRTNQAGTGLWLYYAAEWTPWGCGPNPQPLYLSDPNAAGCPPSLTSGQHSCVPVSRFGVQDDGSAKGYAGRVPPLFITADNTLEQFNARVDIEGTTHQIRFYRLRLDANGTPWVVGLGYEVRGGADFEPLAAKPQVLGPKSFRVQVGGVSYRVLLRRGGGEDDKEQAAAPAP